ncbi:hypothetical protein JXL21_09890 [Candidatus Bathyarchaeota archaeon]|nr:hypothetical protein [Candidatus Bathyarchaeota archaeon]
MEIDFESEWLEERVELFKTLQGFKYDGYDEENSSLDYMNNGGEAKLLKVFADPKGESGKVSLDSARHLVEALGGTDFEEVIVVAEHATDSAYKYLTTVDNFELVTPKSKPSWSTMEILQAVKETTVRLCESKCGKAPQKESDCKGYEKGKAVCPIRVVSDNANFHAERGWYDQLLLDFKNLISIEKMMD